MPNSVASRIVAELRTLSTRIDEQRAEMASLRVKLEIQFKRIAYLQAELDVLPIARRQRRSRRLVLLSTPGSHSAGA
jgi:hypothetical protein